MANKETGLGYPRGPAVFIQIGKYDSKKNRRFKTKFKVIRGISLEDLEKKVSDIIRNIN